MKKIILVILLLFAGFAIAIFVGIQWYSDKINNGLSQKEQKIRPVWKDLLDLTNQRIQVIGDLYKEYNCDNNRHIKTFDSIITEKKSSEDYMKKNFHPLELQANIILLDLYNCKGVDKNELNSVLKSYNDSLSAKVKEYNSLIPDYNSDVFNLLNSFFIDHEKYISKRYIGIDYSNDLKTEVKKQSEIENWIKTGKLPNDSKN